MMSIVRWYVKKLKYLIVGVSLLNIRTGWIDLYANIQVLVLFSYVMNIVWINLLFLPMRESYYGSYLFLTIGFSIILLIPYSWAMYGIFHKRILHSEEATIYANRFARKVALSKAQQYCAFVILGFHPLVILSLLIMLKVILR